MADILIFDSHQSALEAGTYKISISQDFSVPGNKPMEIIKTDLDFIVAGEQYTIDEQQIDSVFPPAAAMGDFSLVLPHIILQRSTLPWERDSMKGQEGNPWLALLLFTEDEFSATEEITEGKLFCVQHVLKETWKKPDEGAKGDLISILVYNSKESIDNIIPKFSELPYLAHVRANGEDQKAVIVCNRLPKIDKKNIVHLVSFENCFDDKKEFSNQNKNPMALVSLKSWEFFCNDHFIITPEVLDKYKALKGTEYAEDLTNALSEIIGVEFFDENILIDSINKNLTPKRDIPIGQKEYLLKTFRIGHLPDILKHLNRTPATLRLPDGSPDYFKISQEKYESYKKKGTVSLVQNAMDDIIDILSNYIDSVYYEIQNLIDILPKTYKEIYGKKNKGLNFKEKRIQAKIDFFIEWFRLPNPEYQFLKQGYFRAPYLLKTGKQIDAFYRGPLIPGDKEKNDNPIVLRYADEALRYFKEAEKLDVSYASAWQLGKLLAIQNKNFSTALYKWKRQCYQTIKQGITVSEKNCPVPVLVRDWFSNLKNLNGIPFNYLVADPSMIPFESIRFFNIDEEWLKYLVDGAFSIGRISKKEVELDNSLYKNESFSFLKMANSGRTGFLLHSVAVAGWPDLVISGSDKDKNPIKNKLSPNLLSCVFDYSISSVSIHQKPGSIHFGFEDINENDKLFNKDIIISYAPVNSPDEAKKIDLTLQTGETAVFVNNLVQKIEVITFQVEKAIT